MDAPRAGLSQRIFAWSLAHFNTRYERFISKYKQTLFPGLSGIVVEIGPGTGANLRYLDPQRVHWIGVEPNLFMESYVRKEADRLGIAVEMRTGTAENLPFGNDSVEAVISTLVLCSVASQQRTLREVMRVLKPGGTFVFVEHVAAPKGSRLRRVQNVVTPFWKRLGDGCHPNRETWKEIERAGFASVLYDKINAPTAIVGPQIIGVAKKAA
jgi:ubiquinone/menaquinone biosynthesis C-methylase UbiE